MAEKLAATYRYVTKDKDGNPVRVVLNPGDDVKDLPKDARDDLARQGLIVDESRLTESGLRIPPGMEGREGSPRERANRALEASGREPAGGSEQPRAAESNESGEQAKSGKKDK